MRGEARVLRGLLNSKRKLEHDNGLWSSTRPLDAHRSQLYMPSVVRSVDIRAL